MGSQSSEHHSGEGWSEQCSVFNHLGHGEITWRRACASYNHLIKGRKKKKKKKPRKTRTNFGEDGFQLFTRGQKNACQISEITHIKTTLSPATLKPLMREYACNAGDPSSIPGSGRSGEGIGCLLQYSWASLVAQLVKNLPAVQETWLRSLGCEDPWRRERLPLQYSGLENSVDYTVHGVTKSRTRLSDFHFLSL